MFKTPSNLPKVESIIFYCYHSLRKIMAILYFMIGSMFIGFTVFPFIRLFSRGRADFSAKARRYVSGSFRRFLFMLDKTGIVHINAEEKEFFRNIRGKIIAANHPSLLDYVCLAALIPNSNCIVKAGLKRTPFIGIIHQIYITNTTDFSELCKVCKEDLDNGSNVLIFPEGTRTPRFERNSYQKGAARIALYSGHDILPLFIGGSDKYGLGKHDPLFSFNPVEEYLYDIKVLPEVKASDFLDLPAPAAAKHITQKIESSILEASEKYRSDHSCRTMNNV